MTRWARRVSFWRGSLSAPPWDDEPIRRADLDEWLAIFQAPEAAELALFDPPPDSTEPRLGGSLDGEIGGSGRTRRSEVHPEIGIDSVISELREAASSVEFDGTFPWSVGEDAHL